MKINNAQADLLFNLMLNIAKAVAEDEEYKHSDYAGMEIHRIREDELEKEKFRIEFNALEDSDE